MLPQSSRKSKAKVQAQMGKAYNRMIRTIFILVILQSAISYDSNAEEFTPPSPNIGNPDSIEFVKTWDKFVSYLCNNDTMHLKEIINFPLTSRGILDSDPIIKYSEFNFMTAINKYFKVQIGVAPCEIGFKKQFANIIKGFRPKYDGGQIVGGFIFSQVNNYWKLTFIYIDNDEVYHQDCPF